MTEERASEVALAIFIYECKRKEVRISPHEDELAEMAKTIGVNERDLKQFCAEVWLPVVIEASTGEAVSIRMKQSEPLSDRERNLIAMKIILNRGVDLSPQNFQRRLMRIRDEMGVGLDELNEFYLSYVLPRAIGKITGQSHVGITIGN